MDSGRLSSSSTAGYPDKRRRLYLNQERSPQSSKRMGTGPSSARYDRNRSFSSQSSTTEPMSKSKFLESDPGRVRSPPYYQEWSDESEKSSQCATLYHPRHGKHSMDSDLLFDAEDLSLSTAGLELSFTQFEKQSFHADAFSRDLDEVDSNRFSSSCSAVPTPYDLEIPESDRLESTQGASSHGSVAGIRNDPAQSPGTELLPSPQEQEQCSWAAQTNDYTGSGLQEAVSESIAKVSSEAGLFSDASNDGHNEAFLESPSFVRAEATAEDPILIDSRSSTPVTGPMEQVMIRPNPELSSGSSTIAEGRTSSKGSISAHAANTDPTALCDTCFGVVTTTAVSSFKDASDTRKIPMNVSACGDTLKLSSQDSNKYAGLILNKCLSTLLSNGSIRLNAMLTTLPKTKDEESEKFRGNEICSSEECSVRIVVCGLSKNRVEVGKQLSSSGLYLQHPSPEEVDGQTQYVNPHYLLRPGTQMPSLEQLFITSDDKDSKSPEVLNEADKSRFMHIFDSANEVIDTSTVEPSPRLKVTLEDHQMTALAMMREREMGILRGAKFSSLWEPSPALDTTMSYRNRVTGACETSPRPVLGGILADEMGLGKTLSLLALVCWSLDFQATTDSIPDNDFTKTLIIAPKSTIHNWTTQIESHIHPGKLHKVIYHGSTRKRLATEIEKADMVLTTYETMRSDWASKSALYTRKWHRLVLDEAHHIRTRSSQIFKAACALISRSRWCLTGTPIQNSLDDYGALLSFIGVQPFTSKSSFNFWIVDPIKKNQLNSLQRLENLVRATCLRRKKSSNSALFKLPERCERIEWVELSLEDRKVYRFFKRKTADIASQLSRKERSVKNSEDQKEGNILTLINFLRLICDHGEHLLPQSASDAWRSGTDAAIDWQMMRTCRDPCVLCGAYVDENLAPDLAAFNFSCQHSICLKCGRERKRQEAEGEGLCPQCSRGCVTRDKRTDAFAHQTYPRASAKVEALIKNLRQEQAPTDGHVHPRKSLVFSCWTKMLDIVQHHLGRSGFNFRRVDGQPSLPDRHRALSDFSEDPSCTVLLASLGSAGEGLNLTAASSVHLLEPHWNPMVEAQAVDRVHRIGQKRDVVMTRYVTSSSIEEYVRWIQKEKKKLIMQSLDNAHVSQIEVDEQRWKKLQSYIDTDRVSNGGDKIPILIT